MRGGAKAPFPIFGMKQDYLSFLNLQFANYSGAGKYGIPEIFPTYQYSAIKWLGFNYVKTTWNAVLDTGVHFFLDDYQFDRVWNKPNAYIPYLQKFACILSPDFSLYRDFPKAVQIFNHYRKHWVARYWQEHGLTVIPTIAWSDEESFEWCFDGEPKNSIVAVSNVGCMRNQESKQLFDGGYKKMLEILQPSEILFYTNHFTSYNGNIHYIRYKNGLTGELIR